MNKFNHLEIEGKLHLDFNEKDQEWRAYFETEDEIIIILRQPKGKDEMNTTSRTRTINSLKRNLFSNPITRNALPENTLRDLTPKLSNLF